MYAVSARKKALYFYYFLSSVGLLTTQFLFTIFYDFNLYFFSTHLLFTILNDSNRFTSSHCLYDTLILMTVSSPYKMLFKCSDSSLCSLTTQSVSLESGSVRATVPALTDSVDVTASGIVRTAQTNAGVPNQV